MPQLSSQPFGHRVEAGEQLAERLREYADLDNVIVLALPRGGVPVGFEVARALHSAVDVFVVRKLGVPGHEELAMGAIATGGVRLVNRDVVDALGVPDAFVDTVATKEQKPARIVVAVPVGAAPTCEELCREADEVVCPREPDPFIAVGLWYRDFSPTSDNEVRALLGRRAS